MDSQADALYIWSMIFALGLGTYIIRLSFLGLIGDRPLPLYLKQMLNYTSVAVLPGIAAPLVITSSEAGGLDPLRLTAAAAILAVGIITQNLLKSLLTGMFVYMLGRWLLGSLA